MPKTEPPLEAQHNMGEEVHLDEATLAAILDHLLHIVLAAFPLKPDEATWNHIGHLDALRRQLQASSGAEQTELTDPHGRVSYPSPERSQGSWPTSPSPTTPPPRA